MELCSYTDLFYGYCLWCAGLFKTILVYLVLDWSLGIVHGVAKSRTPLSDFHFHAFYDESRLGFKVRLNRTLT